MSLESILASIESSALADWMRYTNGAMPIVESVHVLAAVLLFGTVLIVDLRLLGVLDASRTFARVSRETLPVTWLAFGLAVITGSLMFTTSAHTYFGNSAFQLKALALLGAGINMALFQLLIAPGLTGRNRAERVPRAARAAGLVSVLFWAAVVLLGRWIGFTKGHDFGVPPEIEALLPASASVYAMPTNFSLARHRRSPTSSSSPAGEGCVSLQSK